MQGLGGFEALQCEMNDSISQPTARGAELTTIAVYAIIGVWLSRMTTIVDREGIDAKAVVAVFGVVVILLLVVHLRSDRGEKKDVRTVDLVRVETSDLEPHADGPPRALRRYVIASPRSRLFAVSFDVAVVLVAALIAESVEQALKPPEEVMVLLWMIVLVSLFHRPLTTWLCNGRTAGKAMFSLRVVRADSRPMTFGTSFLREFFQSISDRLLHASWDIEQMHWDSERRTSADYWARTLVIYDP